jgi:hypothetical protein
LLVAHESIQPLNPAKNQRISSILELLKPPSEESTLD